MFWGDRKFLNKFKCGLGYGMRWFGGGLGWFGGGLGCFNGPLTRRGRDQLSMTF